MHDIFLPVHRLTHNMAMIQPSFTSSKWNMGEILPTIKEERNEETVKFQSCFFLFLSPQIKVLNPFLLIKMHFRFFIFG